MVLLLSFAFLPTCAAKPAPRSEREAPLAESVPEEDFLPLMVASVDAYNEERYLDAEALARLATEASPSDTAALELLGDCRRMRHGGGDSPYREELRVKYLGRRETLGRSSGGE